ncbi:MAG: spore photoproduct lyase family protein [Mycobacterium sp.]
MAVVAPPSKRRLQPIPPSADWRIDLATGCPGHCQYCYLAGSLSGPPITRVVRQSARNALGDGRIRRPRHHHLGVDRPCGGGHHFRGVLLHRRPLPGAARRADHPQQRARGLSGAGVGVRLGLAGPWWSAMRVWHCRDRERVQAITNLRNSRSYFVSATLWMRTSDVCWVGR